MDEEKKKAEEQMSSEDMFNSWSAQLMEGVEEQPVSSKTSTENKAQSFDTNKKDAMIDKAQPFNSENKQIINTMEKINFDTDVMKTNSSIEDNFSNGFNYNNQNKQQEISSSVSQPSQMMQDGQMGNNIENSVLGKDSKNDTGENNSPVIGMIFLAIIVFGVGYFIYDSIVTSKLKEEEEIYNVSDTSKNEDKKNNKDNKNDKNDKEDVTGNQKEDNENTGNNGNTGNESGTEQNGNDILDHSQELRRLCSLTNDNGEYYAEMTGNLNDINYLIENARYCANNSCLYTQGGFVYSRNCASGLETKMTIEEAKISTTLGVACIEFNNTGSYTNTDMGITCSNGHCRATYNGRNFDQNCSKYK